MDKSGTSSTWSRRAVLTGAGGLSLLAMGGCSRVRGSRLNPLNWFGRSRSEEPTLAPSGGYIDEVDQRAVIQSVASMRVDRIPGGAIVTATGLPPTQGFWNADLVPTSLGADDRPVRDGSTITFDFRIVAPEQSTRQGPAQSRELTAAYSLTDQDLVGVRSIVVRGQSNQRSARR